MQQDAFLAVKTFFREKTVDRGAPARFHALFCDLSVGVHTQIVALNSNI